MQTLFQRFVKDESGATAIEYGLIAAIVAVALITVLGTMGGTLQNAFDAVSDGLAGVDGIDRAN